MRDASPTARPTIGVTIGDPGGIGPEVVVKALADRGRRNAARFVVFGSSQAMHAAADAAGLDADWWRIEADSGLIDATRAHDVVLIDYDRKLRETGLPGAEALRFDPRPTRLGGELSFRLVEDAIAAARLARHEPGHVDAIVTAPISKQAWRLAGRRRYPGHTELLADRFRAKRVAMMFAGPRLNVVLATVHVPLMEVRDVLTIGRIYDAIDLGAEGCRMLGIDRPRIAVCGLNPHAGEDGLLGDEETRLIEPAIELAVRHGVDASGPVSADTVFLQAAAGRYDLVVAMYHDQGLIPVKLLDRDATVNLTLGLPSIRTSPDHGTAFDIAGTNGADPRSTAAAMDLAVRMAAPARADAPAPPAG